LIRFGDRPISRLWCSLAGRSNGCLIFGDGPLLAAVGVVPSLCLPNILVFHHQYIQASLLHLAFTLASCSGVLHWLRALLAPCSGILHWLRALVIALAGLSLGRHMRSLRCGRLVDFVEWLCIWVEGGQVRTVEFVRSRSVRSMFDRPFGK
jgi:hypothetical protein